jgi:predicted nucleic acid-binding protein
MTIDRNTLLFFDASCLIAAAGSPAGGSGFLLSLCARGFLKAAVSQMVLLEAQRNIQTKLGDDANRHFYNLLAIVPFSLASVPDRPKLERLVKFINKKDVHVIASALEVQAHFLLALDNKLILEINSAKFSVLALAPGDFIKTVLPNHMDYPSTRD